MGTRIMRIYGHGENGYMKDHVIAIYEEVNEAQNGQKIVVWDRGDVGNNARWHKKKHRMMSHRNGGEDHCMAVMEEGDGPNGFKLVTWPRHDTGKNAKFHFKSEDTSSDESD